MADRGLTADIGGSKARIVYYQQTGKKEVFEISGSYGRAEESDFPLTDLAKALSGLPVPHCEIGEIAVNLGGKNKRQVAMTLSAAFPRAKVSVWRESEGAAALRMMSLFECNVVVMAGTGCIALAKSGETESVVGGWGKDIGDQGSGYSIGLAAIQGALRELDGTAKNCSLTTREITGCANPLQGSVSEFVSLRDGIRARLPRAREEIAALTRTVVNCAERGCPSAKKILRDCGREIGGIAAMAARKAGIKVARVLINGGLTLFNEWWKQAYEAAVTKICVENTFFINDGIDIALKDMLSSLERGAQ